MVDESAPPAPSTSEVTDVARRTAPWTRVLAISAAAFLVWLLLFAPTLQHNAQVSPVGTRRTVALDISSAAGKYSRSWWRSRWTCRVRSQISVLWVRATTLTAAASGLSPATARSWWESVRTMSVSMCASPRSLLAPDTPWRSRYLEACSGFTP